MDLATIGFMHKRAQGISKRTGMNSKKTHRAVANVNILEGIRFYVSFACSFAFGELKFMEGSAKIIKLYRQGRESTSRNHSEYS